MEIQENNLTFKLNLKDLTASLTKCSQNSGSVVVPRLIKYEKKNYKVISISSEAFEFKHLDSLTFANNSEVTTFDISAFERAYITKIEIPPKLKFIKDRCFHYLKNFYEFDVSPKNSFFMFHNNEILIGKNEEKSDSFDAVYYARSDLKEVTVPASVKILKNYCFSGSNDLESIKFEDNSQIEKIGGFVLGENLKKLEIPKTLKQTDFYCFDSAKSLVDLEVSPENEVYKYIDDSMLIKNHSNIIFCRRNATKVIIPNYITDISFSAFQDCKNLVSISFEENSSLESIYDSAFNDVPGQENLVIPASVKNVYECAFLGMDNLKTVVFLGEEVKISKGVFGCCRNLVSVSFPNAKKIIYDNEIAKKTKIYVKENAEITGQEIDQKRENIEFIVEIQESRDDQNLVLEQDEHLNEAENQEKNENNTSKCCLLI